MQLIINNELLMQFGTGTGSCIFPITYTKWYDAVAISIDDTDNVCCCEHISLSEIKVGGQFINNNYYYSELNCNYIAIGV